MLWQYKPMVIVQRPTLFEAFVSWETVKNEKPISTQKNFKSLSINPKKTIFTNLQFRVHDNHLEE